MLSRSNYINSPVEIKFEILRLFKKNDRLIIFDIGACEGEDSIRYSKLFPNSTIYAFEPRADNFKKGGEMIKQYNRKNILLFNIALSDKNGTAEFYLSEGEPGQLKNDENWNYGNKSSSLLPPSEELKKHTAWLNFKNKTIVETKRLNEFVKEKNISTIDFMHIDVQGAELMVFEGAGDYLKNIKVVWTEVEAVKLYENQPVKRDIEKFMIKNHFINIYDTVNEIAGDQLYVNLNFFSREKINILIRARKRAAQINKFKSFLKFLRPAG
jgi:FkbM family methyltransferase